MKRLPIQLMLLALLVTGLTFGQNSNKLQELSAQIAFENSESNELKENMGSVLDAIAQVLKEDKFMYEIGSHSSRDGSERVNLQKTETRAQRIKDELVKRGIQSWRLMPIGYGESQPLKKGGSKALDSQNERVLIKIFPN